jgi:thiosulfate/3-mercaptopyruvate sulfurtransferase
MKLMIKRVVTLALALTIIMTFVACKGNDVPTDYLSSNNVIEASQLNDLLSDSKTIVIDARSEEDYNKGHLKGAICLPAGELTTSEPVPGLIASKEQVEKVLSEHGISNDSHVYIYDNKNGIYASRIWWVLKVYGHEHVKVIDGGDAAIVEEMGVSNLTTEATKLTPTTYSAKEADLSIYASIDDILAVIENEDSKGRIIDVRSAAEHAEGTIPGAFLYPHTNNTNEDGTFKSPWEIYLDYEDKGFERSDEIYVFCKSSVRASQTLLLLQEAGYSNVKVYDGAWFEWSVKDDAPKVEQVEDKVAPSTGDGS